MVTLGYPAESVLYEMAFETNMVESICRSHSLDLQNCWQVSRFENVEFPESVLRCCCSICRSAFWDSFSSWMQRCRNVTRFQHSNIQYLQGLAHLRRCAHIGPVGPIKMLSCHLVSYDCIPRNTRNFGTQPTQLP